VDLIRLGIGLAAVVAVSVSYYTGHKAGSNAVSYQWEQDKLARTQRLLEQEARHRKTERQWGESLAKIIDAERASQEASRNELEAIIADRESGTLVLRDRFRGCEQRLSEATATAGGADGGSEGGLSPADEKFLVRVAQSCDSVIARFTALQRYVGKVCLNDGA
jgi:hypothetical protein